MARIVDMLLPDKTGRSIAVEVLLLTGLLLIGMSNYLLFHGLVEIFGVVISVSIFLVVWTSRRIVRNSYLLLLGVAFLAVGLVDALHTLAYKGMGAFPEYGADQATQLWMIARFLQASALFAAPLVMNRRLREEYVLGGAILAVGLLLLTVFVLPVFPAAYVEGQGLTPFKIAGEYAIMALLLGAGALHFRKRSAFDPEVLRLIIASILAGVVSELCFTLYVGVYDALNMIGHLLKVVSFYFLYKAFIHTAIARPYRILFRDLAEERDRAQRYFDIAGVILLVIGADGKVLRINRQGARILGYPDAEILGRDWFDTFIPERVREDLRDRFRRILNGDAEEGAIGQGYENPVLTRNGERIILWNNSLLWDERGVVTGTLSSGEDITERRRAEEAERYRELFENVDDSVFIVGPGGRFLEANDRTLEMTGYSRAELPAISIRDLIPPEEISLLDMVDDQISREGRALFEFDFRTREGAVVPLYLSCKRISFRGDRAYLCVARDIAALKRLQEDLVRSERLAVTGRLTASIVHEVKNPLSIIGGFARSIVKKPGDMERVVRNAGIIVDEIDRLEHLVADMLDFSRPSPPRKERIDLAGLLDGVIRLVEREAAARGVRIESLLPGTPLEVELDPGRMKQVFLNLVQNALNAMPDGGSLRVSVTGNGRWAAVDIVDSGHGIPPELQERVFEPFFTTRGKGTGLGLAISRRIVESHGGSITLASEQDVGTTVHVQLPR